MASDLQAFAANLKDRRAIGASEPVLTPTSEADTVAQKLAVLPESSIQQIAANTLATYGNPRGQNMTSAGPSPYSGEVVSDSQFSENTPVPAVTPATSQGLAVGIPQGPVSEQVPQQAAPLSGLAAQADMLDRNAAASGAQAQKGIDQSVGMQQKAGQDKVVAEQKIREAQAPLQQERLGAAQAHADAQQELNDWHTSEMLAVQNHMNETNEARKAEAAKNPSDLWGNSTTGGKIAGILGIIAAGFAHQDATQRVEHMIDRSIADSDRRMKMFAASDDRDLTQLRLNEQIFGSKAVANANEKADKLEIVGLQMEQMASKMQNPIAQANLLQASGILKGSAAVLKEKVNSDVLAHRAQMLQSKIHLEQIAGQERAALYVAMKPSREETRFNLEQQRREVEGGIQGFKSPQPGHAAYLPKGGAEEKFRSVQGAAHAMIDAGDSAMGLIDKIHRAELSGDISKALALRAQYKSIARNLITVWRKYTESGANITGSEQENFDNAIPTFFSTLSGKGDLLKDVEGLKMARYMIVNNLSNSGNAISPNTAVFDPTFEKYAPSIEWHKQQTGLRGGAEPSVEDIINSDAEAYRARSRSPRVGRGY